MDSDPRNLVFRRRSVTSHAAESSRRRGPAGRRRRWIAGSFGAVTVLLLLAVLVRQWGTGPKAGVPDFVQHLAVPAYIDPQSGGPAWDQLLATAGRGHVGLIVVNVASGPGHGPDPGWQQRISEAHRAGARVLGYVDTGYFGVTGARTRTGSVDRAAWLEQIRTDTREWHTWFTGIDGVFLDQVPNECGPPQARDAWALMYVDLDRWVKQQYPGAYTVANPGSAVPQCYEDAADTLVTFEGTYATYVSSRYLPLGWNPVDPDKICHLVHDVPSRGAMTTLLNLTRARTAGYVYATDAGLPDPWDSLPAQPLWSGEQEELGPINPVSRAAPSAPSGLRTVSRAPGQVTLAWAAAATGGSVVVAYQVYRDGVWMGSTRSDRRSFTVEDVSGHVTVTVRARDAVGHLGTPSPPLVVSSVGPSPTGP